MLATSLSAQQSPPRRHLCFRGQPSATCDAFWLTEFGVAATLESSPPVSRDAVVTWELGWMVNRGPKRALGAAAFAQVGSGLDAFGIRPRMRFWMSRTVSLDVAPGIVLHGSKGAPGFSGIAAFNYGDYLALTTHIVAMRPVVYDPSRWRTAALVGARLGSVPGAIVGGTSVALLLAFFVWCASENCFAD